MIQLRTFLSDFPDGNEMLTPGMASNASEDWEVDSKCLLAREDNNELDMHIPSTISKHYHQDINCSSNKP